MSGHARGRVALWQQIFRLLPAAGGPLLVGALALEVVAGVLPVAFIVGTSAVVGRVPPAVGHGTGSAEWRSLRNALLATGVLFLLQQATWPLQWAVGESISWRVDDQVRERVVAASFEPVGVAALEDTETLDELTQIVNPLRGFGFTPGSACAGLVALVRRYVQWALAAVLVGVVFAWWAALAAAAGALVVRVATRSGLGRLGAVEASYAPARRRRDYFRDLLVEGAPAKEVRIFGLLPWLQGRYRAQALAAVQPVWAARRRVVYRPYLLALPVAAVVSAIATVAVARAAAHGDVTLGEMAFVLQAIVLIGMLGEFAYESDYQTEFGLQAYAAVERFERRAAGAGSSDGGDPSGRPRSEIRFEDVWFTYPGAERPALRGVNLAIAAGRSLAIVGLNGAGKTTLVTLLARLHDPDRGRITVDGIDIRRFPPREWQRRLAAIFQDFVHYELSVADNVALGARHLGGDRERMAAVLEAAGAKALVDDLPRGLDTILSREYEDGADLSGGQWQRVALARALAAVEDGAGVLVLDEPTANLDVRAEVELFDRLLEVTAGLTTILISHRFSTVRRAERIVVLEEGAVVEEGTHGELLARGGRYARLFRLQAARFGAEPPEGAQ